MWGWEDLASKKGLDPFNELEWNFLHRILFFFMRDSASGTLFIAIQRCRVGRVQPRKRDWTFSTSLEREIFFLHPLVFLHARFGKWYSIYCYLQMWDGEDSVPKRGLDPFQEPRMRVFFSFIHSCFSSCKIRQCASYFFYEDGVWITYGPNNSPSTCSLQIIDAFVCEKCYNKLTI